MQHSNPKQYQVILHYLSSANSQLKEWVNIPRLRDRFETLRREVLEVCASLSEEDSRRVTLRLATGGHIDFII